MSWSSRQRDRFMFLCSHYTEYLVQSLVIHRYTDSWLYRELHWATENVTPFAFFSQVTDRVTSTLSSTPWLMAWTQYVVSDTFLSDLSDLGGLSDRV